MTLRWTRKKKLRQCVTFMLKQPKTKQLSALQRGCCFLVSCLSQICVSNETIIIRFVNLCFYMRSDCFQLELVCLSLSLRSQQFTGDMDSRCTWRRTNQLVFKYTLYVSSHQINYTICITQYFNFIYHNVLEI